LPFRVYPPFTRLLRCARAVTLPCVLRLRTLRLPRFTRFTRYCLTFFYVGYVCRSFAVTVVVVAFYVAVHARCFVLFTLPTLRAYTRCVYRTTLRHTRCSTTVIARCYRCVYVWLPQPGYPRIVHTFVAVFYVRRTRLRSLTTLRFVYTYHTFTRLRSRYLTVTFGFRLRLLHSIWFTLRCLIGYVRSVTSCRLRCRGSAATRCRLLTFALRTLPTYRCLPPPPLPWLRYLTVAVTTAFVGCFTLRTMLPRSFAYTRYVRYTAVRLLHFTRWLPLLPFDVALRFTVRYRCLRVTVACTFTRDCIYCCSPRYTVPRLPFRVCYRYVAVRLPDSFILRSTVTCVCCVLRYRFVVRCCYCVTARLFTTCRVLPFPVVTDSTIPLVALVTFGSAVLLRCPFTVACLFNVVTAVHVVTLPVVPRYLPTQPTHYVTFTFCYAPHYTLRTHTTALLPVVGSRWFYYVLYAFAAPLYSTLLRGYRFAVGYRTPVYCTRVGSARLILLVVTTLRGLLPLFRLPPLRWLLVTITFTVYDCYRLFCVVTLHLNLTFVPYYYVFRSLLPALTYATIVALFYVRR